MARVNITLPDSLHERVQEFKDSINVSAVCQRALEQVVEMEKAKAMAQTARDKAIANLRFQAKNAANEWYEQGKKEGLEAATDTGYDDFVQLADCLKHMTAEESIDSINNDCGAFDWVREAAEEQKCPSSQVGRFMAGVADGLMEFWRDVREEVEAS